jgi:hypothetical protein
VKNDSPAPLDKSAVAQTEFRNRLVPARNADLKNLCVLTHADKEDKPR